MRLYIDVDDTLLARSVPNGGFDLRPAVMSQLSVLSRIFECFWLTHRTQPDLLNFMDSLFRRNLYSRIQYMHWREINKKDKAPAVINAGGDFFWLEDPLSTGSLKELEDAGMMDRYISVEPTGPWGFVRALRVLFEKASITPEDIKDASGSMSLFKEPIGTYFDWTYYAND